MPEGHTIHRLAARHLDLFGGRRVHAESPQGRFAEGAAALDGAVLRATEAYGKHLLHVLVPHLPATSPRSCTCAPRNVR